MRQTQTAIPPLIRFQLVIWPRGDCWEWRGSRTMAGYGLHHWLRWDQPEYAHRHSFELAKGALPNASTGIELDHLCNHPWCVRPSHLVAVTSGENTTRGIRLRLKPHCPHGHPYELVGTKRVCRTCNRERCTAHYRKHAVEIRASWKRRYASDPAFCESEKRRANAAYHRLYAKPRVAVTHCPSGHPYSGSNLSYSKEGHRRCRACGREYYHRTKNLFNRRGTHGRG